MAQRTKITGPCSPPSSYDYWKDYMQPIEPETIDLISDSETDESVIDLVSDSEVEESEIECSDSENEDEFSLTTSELGVLNSILEDAIPTSFDEISKHAANTQGEPPLVIIKGNDYREIDNQTDEEEEDDNEEDKESDNEEDKENDNEEDEQDTENTGPPLAQCGYCGGHEHHSEYCSLHVPPPNFNCIVCLDYGILCDTCPICGPQWRVEPELPAHRPYMPQRYAPYRRTSGSPVNRHWH